MTGKKWFLAVAAVLFVGWIAYLGWAVVYHRWVNPPDVVSRSQLVEAKYVVVVEVTLAGGKPDPTATVVKKLDGDGPEAKEGAEVSIVVKNLPEATTPANQPLPGPGKYLVALVPDFGADPRTGPYRIAGWPRGLGESTVQPGQKIDPTKDDSPKVRPPLAYPWTDAVEKQMTGLGYK